MDGSSRIIASSARQIRMGAPAIIQLAPPRKVISAAGSHAGHGEGD